MERKLLLDDIRRRRAGKESASTSPATEKGFSEGPPAAGTPSSAKASIPDSRGNESPGPPGATASERIQPTPAALAMREALGKAGGVAALLKPVAKPPPPVPQRITATDLQAAIKLRNAKINTPSLGIAKAAAPPPKNASAPASLAAQIAAAAARRSSAIAVSKPAPIKHSPPSPQEACSFVKPTSTLSAVPPKVSLRPAKTALVAAKAASTAQARGKAGPPVRPLNLSSVQHAPIIQNLTMTMMSASTRVTSTAAESSNSTCIKSRKKPFLEKDKSLDTNIAESPEKSTRSSAPVTPPSLPCSQNQSESPDKTPSSEPKKQRSQSRRSDNPIIALKAPTSTSSEVSKRRFSAEPSPPVSSETSMDNDESRTALRAASSSRSEVLDASGQYRLLTDPLEIQRAWRKLSCRVKSLPELRSAS